MKLKKIVIFTTVLLTTSCLPFVRGGGIGLLIPKEYKLQMEFEDAVYDRDIERVKKYIEMDLDPNRCKGGAWELDNPINILSNNGPHDSVTDRELLTILIKAGADINLRPYIWEIVFKDNIEHTGFTNGTKTWIGYSKEFALTRLTEGEFLQQLNQSIERNNAYIELFIELGADPNKLGHPYPYTFDLYEDHMNNNKANRYFKDGTTPLNIAIEKGILWESQVDILLKYSKPDSSSLLAAEKSNDPEMIEKISQLLNTPGN